jgi:hypothetical protein
MMDTTLTWDKVVAAVPRGATSASHEIAGKTMKLSWYAVEKRIWFARWEDHRTRLRLYAVVEGVPGRTTWDWTVWLPDEPKIVERGVAQSALAASVAADEAAEQCLRASGEYLKGL